MGTLTAPFSFGHSLFSQIVLQSLFCGVGPDMLAFASPARQITSAWYEFLHPRKTLQDLLFEDAPLTIVSHFSTGATVMR